LSLPYGQVYLLISVDNRIQQRYTSIASIIDEVASIKRNDLTEHAMKIALLEDNPTNSEFIQTVLQMEGHQTFPYADGDSLFQALQTTGDFFPYDVAIIDLWLPGAYSGQDVMRHIQQGYSWEHLPFIVLSALSLNILTLVQADFPETPIIRKPFKSRELLAAIHMVVARP